MHEATLRDFFVGRIDAKSLAEDLIDACTVAPSMTFHNIVNMDSTFAVESSHLVKLCDAVLNGLLSAEKLESIGFCLVASDTFEWNSSTPDGTLLAETIHDWAAPEINFPLTRSNVLKFRHQLLTKENVFQPEDASKLS